MSDFKDVLAFLCVAASVAYVISNRKKEQAGDADTKWRRWIKPTIVQVTLAVPILIGAVLGLKLSMFSALWGAVWLYGLQKIEFASMEETEGVWGKVLKYLAGIRAKVLAWANSADHGHDPEASAPDPG